MGIMTVAKVLNIILFSGMIFCSCIANASMEFDVLGTIPGSATTGEKPQSKVWHHDEAWWAVMPTDNNSAIGAPIDGVWVWRLAQDDSWFPVLMLLDEDEYGSSITEGFKADVLKVGDISHILLHRERSNRQDFAVLVSVEYNSSSQSYSLWSLRPSAVHIPLPRSETATIAMDSYNKLWLATETNGTGSGGPVVMVYSSEAPYVSFSGPVEIGSGIKDDDISAIIALPDNAVGVVWSNQNDKKFYFRKHYDNDVSESWGVTETLPYSVCDGKQNMADDHISLAVSSAGYLYVTVKTSYDKSSCPTIGLFIRSPAGSWSNMYSVEERNGRTRPIVMLNESAGTVQVLYSESTSGGDIVIKETSMTSPDFQDPPQIVLSGSNNDVSGPKDNWDGEVVVLAKKGRSVRIKDIP